MGLLWELWWDWTWGRDTERPGWKERGWRGCGGEEWKWVLCWAGLSWGGLVTKIPWAGGRGGGGRRLTWWKEVGLTGGGGGGRTFLLWLKPRLFPSRERMLDLKVLREERKSKALPSVGGGLTLLQLEYWKRAARRTSRRRENSLIVIICNNWWVRRMLTQQQSRHEKWGATRPVWLVGSLTHNWQLTTDQQHSHTVQTPRPRLHSHLPPSLLSDQTTSSFSNCSLQWLRHCGRSVTDCLVLVICSELLFNFIWDVSETPNVILIFQPAFPSLLIPFLSE